MNEYFQFQNHNWRNLMKITKNFKTMPNNAISNSLEQYLTLIKNENKFRKICFYKKKKNDIQQNQEIDLELG